jgi:lysophospholipid acyltransferase (LPLAT)-like uncharacterized protein
MHLLRLLLSRTVLPRVMRLLHCTLRKRVILPKQWPDSGFIAAFWHGKMLTGWLAVADTLLKIHPSAPIAVVSLSKDGELLAHALHTLGFQLIRGSSSRGREAVRFGIQSALEKGAVVVLTPDGPRGPKESFKYGSIRLAAQYRSPILFFAITHHRAWRLRSWDQFEIPKPFSRVDIVIHRIEVPSFDNEQTLRAFSDSLSAKFSSAIP